MRYFFKCNIAFLKLIVLLWFPIIVEAHQDRIYTFEKKNVTVDILTGFDHFIELQKSDILSSVVSVLANDINKKIKINYIHSYISRIDPEVYLSYKQNSILNDGSEIFKESNKNTIYINVFADQLPIEMIIKELTKFLSFIDKGEDVEFKNYEVKYLYSTFKLSGIDKDWINDNKKPIKWDNFLDKIEGFEFSPGEDFNKRKPRLFFYCDGNFHITSHYLDADVVYSTNRLYQILLTDDFETAFFIFETNDSFLFLEEDINLDTVIISSTHWISDMDDNYNPYKSIPIGKKRYIIQYTHDFSSESLYYRSADDKIIYNLVDILDQSLD